MTAGARRTRGVVELLLLLLLLMMMMMGSGFFMCAPCVVFV